VWYFFPFDSVSKSEQQKLPQSEHFENQIEKSQEESILITLAYKSMTSHFPGLTQTLKKRGGVKLNYNIKYSK